MPGRVQLEMYKLVIDLLCGEQATPLISQGAGREREGEMDFCRWSGGLTAGGVDGVGVSASQSGAAIACMYDG